MNCATCSKSIPQENLECARDTAQAYPDHADLCCECFDLLDYTADGEAFNAGPVKAHCGVCFEDLAGGDIDQHRCPVAAHLN